MILRQVPYFNAPIYLPTKASIGKVDEILGPINEVRFTLAISRSVSDAQSRYSSPSSAVLESPRRPLLPETKSVSARTSYSRSNDSFLNRKWPSSSVGNLAEELEVETEEDVEEPEGDEVDLSAGDEALREDVVDSLREVEEIAEDVVEDVERRGDSRRAVDAVRRGVGADIRFSTDQCTVYFILHHLTLLLLLLRVISTSPFPPHVDPLVQQSPIGAVLHEDEYDAQFRFHLLIPRLIVVKDHLRIRDPRLFVYCFEMVDLRSWINLEREKHVDGGERGARVRLLQLARNVQSLPSTSISGKDANCETHFKSFDRLASRMSPRSDSNPHARFLQREHSSGQLAIKADFLRISIPHRVHLIVDLTDWRAVEFDVAIPARIVLY